jgi:GNAT superfamily N-acetyltransferase
VAAPFAIELLGDNHDRAAFSCGVDSLDKYFKQQASQDVRRRATACYVMRELASDTVAGYYTLAAGSIHLSAMPQRLAKKLPRYPDVPVARVGRLAVDLHFRGRKLGAVLLWDSIERAAKSEVMVYGMIVDAKNDEAVAFYEHFGFLMLNAEARQLVWPIKHRSK